MRNTTAWAGIAALFLMGLVPAAHAQTTWSEGGKLESTEIVVEKNRVIELPEANRNFQKFRLDPPKLQARNVTYRYNEYRLPEHFINLPMRVLTMSQEDLSKLYGNYVKGGLGNYGTVFLRGYFHNKRSETSSFGAEVGHLSSSRGPVRREESKASSSFLQAYGDVYQGDLTIGGRMRYERDQNRFYGYDPAAEFNKDTLQQTYNRFMVEGHLNNHIATKSPFQYEAKLGLTYTKENFNAKETNLYAGLETSYSLSDETKLLVDVNTAYTNYEDTAATGRGFFKIRPAYYMKSDRLRLLLGATIAYTGDEVNDARKFNIYPAIEAGYQLIENQLELFGGATGDLQRTTLYSLSKENPFLNHNLQIADVNKGLEFYGGLNGSIGSSVQFTGRLAYQQYRNLYFYNNAVSDSTKFDLVYDGEGVTKVFQIFGQLTFNQSEDLRLGLKAENNSYTTKVLTEPFHRPSTIVTAFGSYNLSDKILLNTELYYISSSFGQITRPDGTTILRETDNVVDLNIKGDYRFSPRFSAFLMGNNILGQKYERLVNYPTQGLSVLGGVTYSF